MPPKPSRPCLSRHARAGQPGTASRILTKPDISGVPEVSIAELSRLAELRPTPEAGLFPRGVEFPLNRVDPGLYAAGYATYAHQT
jgi:hypothetical protein